MKSLTFLFVSVIFSTLFGSCCDSDKVCAAGNSDLGSFPYSYGSIVYFGDTLGNKIGLRFYEGNEASLPYEVKGKCSVPRKGESCVSSIWLKADIVDSLNILGTGNDHFMASFSKEETVGREIKVYSMFAFGTVQMMVNVNQDSLEFESLGLEKVFNFKTPFKNYHKVYLHKLNLSFNIYKSCFTPNGRLISFSLLKDSGHFFYEME